MNPAYGAYAALSSGLFVSAFPFMWLHSRLSGRKGPPMNQRLGVYEPRYRNIPGSPRIWIHAVSVGEVNVAGAIIQALKDIMPGCGIILSTATSHGFASAREKLEDEATCVYAPLDFILSVRNALATLKPDILVCLETEIWPNWLMAAHRMGIKTALVNGRFSVRSIQGYLKIRPLMHATFAPMGAFSMIHSDDAHRIRLLGAPPQKVTVGGNAKYDLLAGQARPAIPEEMARLYRVSPATPVIVAGSTRGNENRILLDIYYNIRRAYPDALLIIAPRHMNRTNEILAQASALGLPCQLRTHLNRTDSPRTAPVVVVDTIGELQDIYSIGTVVFCGGSLVPLGGQNVLEAAVWGKPIFYGPSMDDFQDARELLAENGGGIQVADEKDLAEKLLGYLSDPEALARMGGRARQAVLSRSGAARKHAEVVHRLLCNP